MADQLIGLYYAATEQIAARILEHGFDERSVQTLESDGPDITGILLTDRPPEFGYANCAVEVMLRIDPARLLAEFHIVEEKTTPPRPSLEGRPREFIIPMAELQQRLQSMRFIGEEERSALEDEEPWHQW